MSIKTRTWSGTTPEIREASRKFCKQLEQEIYGQKSVWEWRKPKSKKTLKEKGPYQHTSDRDVINKILKFKIKGKYKIIHKGYKYWIMSSGMGRRKLTEKDLEFTMGR